MLIKPENAKRYPANWKQIVAQVRERSGNRCEGSPAFPDCRVMNGAVGYRVDGRWVQLGESRSTMPDWRVMRQRISRHSALGQGHRGVVLTW